MIKDTMVNKNGIKIDVEYDESKYKIEDYSNFGDMYKNIYVVKRKENNKIIGIFKNASFIIQKYEDEENKTGVNFLVGFNIENQAYLHHYEYNDNGLTRLHQFKTIDDSLNIIRLSDNAFLVYDCDDKNCIYNWKKDYLSRAFDVHILDSNIDYFKIDEYKGDKSLCWITEKYEVGDIIDRIIYGFNSETCEVETSVYSLLRQKVIPLYTKERIEQLKKEGKLDSYSGHNAFRATLKIEIEDYIRENYDISLAPNIKQLRKEYHSKKNTNN